MPSLWENLTMYLALLFPPRAALSLLQRAKNAISWIHCDWCAETASEREMEWDRRESTKRGREKERPLEFPIFPSPSCVYSTDFSGWLIRLLAKKTPICQSKLNDKHGLLSLATTEEEKPSVTGRTKCWNAGSDLREASNNIKWMALLIGDNIFVGNSCPSPTFTQPPAASFLFSFKSCNTFWNESKTDLNL